MKHQSGLLGGALVFFVFWTAATWYFEGRIETLLRPGTIVFHNFLGTFGVVQALSQAKALSSLEQLQIPLIVTAVITASLLAAGYLILHRAPGAMPTGRLT